MADDIKRESFLVLEDGSVYSGQHFGAQPPKASDLEDMGPEKGDGGDRSIGEVVFNTGMTGYYEILTDPSYTGQIVAMTYPHIGNYGVDPEWSETSEERGVKRPAIKASGMVVRSLYKGVIPPGRMTLDEILKQHDTPAISGVDTRRLTLRLRDGGSALGIIVRSSTAAGLSARELDACTAFLSRYPRMEGRSLVHCVGTAEEYALPAEISAPPAEGRRIAVVDYGIKANILREVRRRGFSAAVFPADIDDPSRILAGAAGVLLSNGPGDPGVLKRQISLVEKLLGKIPVCGICLGHQLIALAMGAKTFKMKFGHHGLNHPVRDEQTGRVFVTSQNHGFSVAAESLPEGTHIRFINANDQTVEGIENRKLSVMTAQFHPEAAPGPFDSHWIFDEFFSLMSRGAWKGGANAG